MLIDVRDESWYAGLTLLERHAGMPDVWTPPAAAPAEIDDAR